MKVSKFFRYLITALSILAVILGAVYWYMYNNQESFKEQYGHFDETTLIISHICVFLSEAVNAIFLVVKECTCKGMSRVKPSASISLPILAFLAITIFVKGGEPFYINISYVIFNIIWFIAGDMFEYGIIDCDGN